VFAGATSFLTGSAEQLFRDGLCLPSGTAMTEEDVDRVSNIVLEALQV
jgi:UDP-N-acetylbacillosamine transaminase